MAQAFYPDDDGPGLFRYIHDAYIRWRHWPAHKRWLYHQHIKDPQRLSSVHIQLLTVQTGDTPWCPGCGSRGFKSKVGTTVLGERFRGCEFCCNDDC